MLNSIIGTGWDAKTFFLCLAVSLLLGAGIAWLSAFRSKSTKSFTVTLAILPAIVQVVIMLVNGNLGAGVAVAGAFSLVRFRSAPGTAKEIGAIFLSMTVGLATGMGYVLLAVVFTAVLAGILLLLEVLKFGESNTAERILRITIPESLDYDGIFDALLEEYTKESALEKVKTTNMGTMYELTYRIVLKTNEVPKAFLDGIRCLNGNLNVLCGKESTHDTL